VKVVGGISCHALLLHGTETASIPAIMSNGLEPRQPVKGTGLTNLHLGGPVELNAVEQPGVYLIHVPPAARDIVMARRAGKAWVLKDEAYDRSFVRTHQADDAIVVVDVASLAMLNTGFFSCPTSIGPERILGTVSELEKAGRLVDTFDERGWVRPTARL
jgi:hypothetical protein